MAKTYIGIDVDNSILRVVALEESGKELKTVALVQREIEESDETAAVVAELLRQWDSTNARLAMTVPAT
ncbi:MAG: hypothetical protein GWN87_01200, partial [Desulfuromonadales bacterium]|nr:hypothetical protein [Desulfuromonadales bacterium]